ncbi:hypothetical protein NPIL_669421, partial [Nephila pilipes]
HGENDLNGEELDEAENAEDLLEKCELPADNENDFSDKETEDDFRSEDNDFLRKDGLQRWAKSVGRKSIKRIL